MPGSGRGMLAGVAAAAVGLGVTQLMAAPLGAVADAGRAVGSAIIDLTPGPLNEWAIQTFGTADKLYLSVAGLVVVAVMGLFVNESALVVGGYRAVGSCR